jgi:hypothetical protein
LADFFEFLLTRESILGLFWVSSMSRDNPFALPPYGGDGGRQRYNNAADDDYDDDNHHHHHVGVTSATVSKLSNGASGGHPHFADITAAANGQARHRTFDSDEDDELHDNAAAHAIMLKHKNSGVSGGGGRDFSSNSPSPRHGSPSLSPERELESPGPDSSDENNPAHHHEVGSIMKKLQCRRRGFK